jgi:putative ABC transport system permease protein
MSHWLLGFAYRIGIPWWIFAGAALLALLIALATVSFQAIRAALVNPVDSLRTE